MGLRIKFSIRAVLILVTLVAAWLAFQTRAIRRYNQAAEGLRQRGGQFEFVPITTTHWVTGTTPEIGEIIFLGPIVDDSDISYIVDVASTFKTRHITLVETLVSIEGQHKLKTQLPKVQFRIVTMSFDGLQIESDQHLVNLVNRTEIGRKVDLVIFRNRQVQTASVQIGKREDFIDLAE